jgi:hypothetical protein
LNKSLQPIYCDKPSTAFFAAAGKTSVYTLSITLVICVFQLCYTFKEVYKQELSQEKKLAKLIHFDAQSGNYFIESNKLSKKRTVYIP